MSPICSSDILTDFPFSRETLADDGKQEGDGEGEGGGHAQHLTLPSLLSQMPQLQPQGLQTARFEYSRKVQPHSQPHGRQNPRRVSATKLMEQGQLLNRH